MDDRRAPGSYAFGDRIAEKYQLIRPLATGGMGVIWVAHNLTLDVHVAMKLIRSRVPGQVAHARLLQEARSAARIAHSGVVRVFDFGTTDGGDPFIVMELLEGETLRDLLEREQRIHPLRAAALLLPVAEALATLSDHGIIHRDLKPDNVILVPMADKRLQPKLVDFGVALLPGTERLTADGLVVGTPDYLAPEQACGEEIDARVDVWAFSLILFELVTGGRPFSGASATQLMNRILIDAPPLLTDFGVGDPELAAIVSRGLAKTPAERWDSIRSLGSALAMWARTRGLTEDVTGASLRASSEPAMIPEGRAPMPSENEVKTELAARRRHWGAPAPGRQNRWNAREEEPPAPPTAPEAEPAKVAEPLAAAPKPLSPRPSPVPQPPMSTPWVTILLGALATLLVLAVALGLYHLASDSASAGAGTVSAPKDPPPKR